MMKKLSALLLALCLMFSVSALADDTVTHFDSVAINSLGMTAAEWYESENSQCLFTVLAALEYTLTEDLDASVLDWTEPSYVGVSDNIVMACFHRADVGSYVIVMYTPSEDCGWMILDGCTSTLMEMVLEQSCSSYVTNDLQTLADVATQLGEILGN